MIVPIPVFAGGLRGRRLQAEDGEIDAATLFPMFGRDGTVHHVMVVDEQSSDIRFLDPGQVAARVPMWGAIRLECGLGCLAWSEEELPAMVGRLWHFDPWWMLAEPRYPNSRAIDLLKATNCVDKMAWPVRGLAYDRKLRKVTWQVGRKQGRFEIGRFTPDSLPAEHPTLPESEGPPDSRSGWRLDPFWLDRW